MGYSEAGAGNSLQLRVERLSAGAAGPVCAWAAGIKIAVDAKRPIKAEHAGRFWHEKNHQIFLSEVALVGTSRLELL
jgi:hypothetical protein